MKSADGVLGNNTEDGADDDEIEHSPVLHSCRQKRDLDAIPGGVAK
jgi:hypothetical protein